MRDAQRMKKSPLKRLCSFEKGKRAIRAEAAPPTADMTRKIADILSAASTIPSPGLHPPSLSVSMPVQETAAAPRDAAHAAAAERAIHRPIRSGAE